MMIRRMAAASLLTAGLTNGLEAALEAGFSSVRSFSRGGAAIADGKGASEFFESPAALAGLSTPELSLLYGKPYAGVPGVDLSVGAVMVGIPTRLGRVGVGLGRFAA